MHQLIENSRPGELLVAAHRENRLGEFISLDEVKPSSFFSV